MAVDDDSGEAIALRRKHLVRALDRFLAQATSRWFRRANVLDPSGLELASELDQLIAPNDVHARYLIGTLHWERSQAMAGHGEADLQAALRAFTYLAPVDLTLVPKPLRAAAAAAGSSTWEMAGSPIDWAVGAATILHERSSAPDRVKLDRAVDLLTAAVSATPAGHPHMTVMRNDLCIALRVRFEHTGNLADLDESVRVGQTAVNTTPDHNALMAMCLSSLGLALRVRFEHAGELTDLDGAVRVGQMAINATAEDDPNLQAMRANLVAALNIRFAATHRLADLDEAIRVGRVAVQATPPHHPNLGGRLTNFGSALSTRYQRTGQLTDLDEAIRVGQRAVDVTPDNHRDLAAMKSHLARALQHRFQHTEKLSDLDEAILIGRQAADLTSQGHHNRSSNLSNLGLALLLRFWRAGAITDLDEAVRLGQEAVDMTPVHHPELAGYLSKLGHTLHTRFTLSASRADLDGAVEAVRRGASLASAPVSTRARCCHQWVRWAVETADWPNAHAGLETVLPLLPQLVGHSLSTEDRRSQLGSLQGLSGLAAWATLEGGTATDPQTVTRAWSVLEAMRGVLLGQALEIRDDLHELAARHPDLARRVRRLRAAISRDSAVDDHQAAMRVAADRVAAVGEWATLMEQIRAVPEFSRFGLPPTIEQMHAASGDGTIVAILITPYACGAMWLNAHDSAFLPLPELTEDELIEHARQFLTTALPPDDRDLAVDPSSSSTYHALNLAVLSRLWEVIAKPVLEQQGHTRMLSDDEPWPRVYWMPTGVASLLPIHAAGHHDQPGDSVLDRVVSSYTPTVRALWHNRRTTPSSSSQENLVVGIDNTPGLPELRYAEAEARQVHRDLAEAGTLLLGSEANHDNVLARLLKARWVHFACHASTDHIQPGDSFLALYDRPLRMRELAELDLTGGHLAMLSACTTAATMPDALDEPIHLASAFQIAGYTHTIATLWPISDPIAPVFTQDIYRHLNGKVPPAEAVHRATRALRANPFIHGRPELWASHIHLGP